MQARRALLPVILIALSVSCADGEVTSTYDGSGTVTLTADTGIDFTTGVFQAKGNYVTSDIYATAGSGYLKLASGGPSPTKNRPVDFFLGPGGIHETFANLAAVPAVTPDPEKTQSLVHAKTGNGFVVVGSDGSVTRGYIEQADATRVVIIYDRVN